MPASKSEKIRIITEFFNWLEGDASDIDVRLTKYGDGGHSIENPVDWISRYADEALTACDTAIMHGPGHQGVSPCIITPAPHDYHVSDRGHEWTDRDITTQTRRGTRAVDRDKIYRLASEFYY